MGNALVARLRQRGNVGGNTVRTTSRISTFVSEGEAERIREWMRLRTTWGDWLGQTQWHHFATLTFRYRASEQSAVKQFMRWIRYLERRAQQRVDWFYAVERFASGAYHLHTLVHGTSSLEASALRKAWQCGRADASRYDPQRGATYYVTKKIGADVVGYDISNVDRWWSHNPKPKHRPYGPQSHHCSHAPVDLGFGESKFHQAVANNKNAHAE